MVLNNTQAEINASTLKQWLSEKLDESKVEERLRSIGLDDESVKDQVRQFKKLLIAKRQSKGFLWMASGAILGFLSCLLSLTNPVPSLYYHILYGFTSLAIVLIFVGLYLVFE